MLSKPFRVNKKLAIGFSGLSIGSPFIACTEAHISEEYKNACVDYGKDDIVFTTKISGTPCTVINTPYVQKTGTTQNWLEKIMSKNKNSQLSRDWNYEYGIFAKLNGVSGSHWNEEQVHQSLKNF